MSVLSGTASDATPAILATGHTDITTVYVSMSARHPEGRDAAYLEWHSLDHRPEQHRMPKLRASFRVVSTPACRAARAVSHKRYDATDHLMTYLFTDLGGMPAFNELSIALAQANRVSQRLPLVERGVYRRDGIVAAPRVKVGADVLPWWPAKGVYVLIERVQAPAPANGLVDVPGVGGAMWGAAVPLEPPFATAPNNGLQITYCFLDDDPPTTGQRLRPLLEKRWTGSNIEPLLAAPFHTLVPYEWGRFVP